MNVLPIVVGFLIMKNNIEIIVIDLVGSPSLRDVICGQFFGRRKYLDNVWLQTKLHHVVHGVE